METGLLPRFALGGRFENFLEPTEQTIWLGVLKDFLVGCKLTAREKELDLQYLGQQIISERLCKQRIVLEDLLLDVWASVAT